MPEFEEITQSLLAPELDIFGIERDPMYVGQYMLPNRLVNAIAHLAAVDGKKSRLLSCDSTGQLAVSDATVQSLLSSPLAVRIQDSDGTDQVRVDASSNMYVTVARGSRVVQVREPHDVALTDYGLVVSSYDLYQVYLILDDVHDPTNHCIRTCAV